MRGSISLERPDLHLAEALTAELRFTAQRLLRDQRIGSDRTRMYLVVHQVREFEHIDVTYGHLLLEGFTRHSIEENGLARFADHLRHAVRLQLRVGLVQESLDLGLRRSVENRRREAQSEHIGSPAEVRF